jgi:hypothetical protein
MSIGRCGSWAPVGLNGVGFGLTCEKLRGAAEDGFLLYYMEQESQLKVWEAPSTLQELPFCFKPLGS